MMLNEPTPREKFDDEYQRYVQANLKKCEAMKIISYYIDEQNTVLKDILSFSEKILMLYNEHIIKNEAIICNSLETEVEPVAYNQNDVLTRILTLAQECLSSFEENLDIEKLIQKQSTFLEDNQEWDNLIECEKQAHKKQVENDFNEIGNETMKYKTIIEGSQSSINFLDVQEMLRRLTKKLDRLDLRNDTGLKKTKRRLIREISDLEDKLHDQARSN